MSLPKLIIAVGAEFDNKGFKKADSAMVKMAKTAKNLGAALGIAYATKKVIAYTKASMAAAAADQRSQLLLSAQLKNLGVAYANVNSEGFIKGLETQSHIVDDILRPSYAQLVRATGSISATEKIMAAAFDVSSGAGLGYAATIDILSQAYVGNLKGLKQLNTGLTNAELAALSFDELLALLNTQFSGAGATAVSGYAGKMDALDVAMGNVQETIGGALLDAFARMAGDGSIDKATEEINNLAGAFALLIGGVTGGKSLSVLLDQFMGFSAKVGKVAGGMGNISMSVQSQNTQIAVKAAEDLAKKKAALDKKNAAAAAAAAKKLENERKAAAAKALTDKKNADALNEASAVFDMNRISIAAALKATLDEETRLRLLAMQAIANDQGELALEYEAKLGYLQSQNFANKLNGITTITDTALNSINSQLLAELKFINTSKMADADKEAARQAAFSKYNDALNLSGGLAAAITYSQKTQDDLAAIAKLAALSAYGAALDTMNKIIKAIELDTISEVDTAQSKADKAKMDALKAYILELAASATAAKAAAAAASDLTTAQTKAIADAAAARIKALADEAAAQAKAIADIAAAQVKAIQDIAAANAAAAALAGLKPTVIPTMPPYIPPTIPPPGGDGDGRPGDPPGATIPPVVTIPPFIPPPTPPPPGPDGSRPGDFNINVSAGVIANPNELVLLIQKSIQDANRNGYNLDVAGAI